ncbi:MAG: hypothetical protein WBD40_25795 [Tepidisphaeraceae bacterium]
MIDEQLEFLISQYADGSLPESERALVELRLRDDAEARALLDEYTALDASLKSTLAVPTMNWDRLADHLSEVVAEEREARATTVLGRIGAWGKLAIAACVVLAAGVALWTQTRPNRDNDVVVKSTNTMTPTAPPVVIVRGPAPQVARAAPVIVVSVGPSSDVTPDWRAAEGVVTGPSRAVWIASGYDAAQDTQRLPY